MFCDPYGAQKKINIQLLSTGALVNFALHGTFPTWTIYFSHCAILPHNSNIQFNKTPPRKSVVLIGKGHAQCHVQLLMYKNLNHKNMFDVFSKLSCRKSSQIWFGWASYEGSLLPRMSSHNLKSFITSSGNAEYSRQSIIRF